MKKMQSLRKSGGWTIVELSVVLTVIAIAAGYVLFGGKGLVDGPKMSSMRDNHVSAVGAIQEFYGPQAYVGLSTEAAVTGGLVDKELARGTGTSTTIATPYSGTTYQILTADSPTSTSFSASAGVAGDHAFLFRYQSVDQAACKSFVSSVAKGSVRVSMGEAGSATLVDVKSFGGDFDAGVMLAQCAFDSIDIDFYYGN